MKKLVKLVLFSLIFGSVPLTSLSSCGGDSSEITSLNFTLNKSYVELVEGEITTVEVKDAPQVLNFGLEKGSLVNVNYNNSQIEIIGVKAGVERVKVYTNNPDEYKSILVVVKAKEAVTNSALRIGENTKTTYGKGEAFYYNDCQVYLETFDENGTLIDQILLTNDEIYFNYENGEIFSESGKYEINVTVLSPSVLTDKYEITVLDNGLSLVNEHLTKLRETNNYEITYKGMVNGVMSIEGDSIFNSNYYINTYSDYYFAKDSTGVFKFNYTTDENGVKNGISTTNGYFKVGGEVVTDLSSVVSLYCNVSGISGFDSDYLASAKQDGDVYVITNSTVLDMLWSKTLNLNGSASELAVAGEENGISFRLNGQLTNGSSLSFTGSIFNIGSAKEDLIENFLATNSTVTYVEDATLKSYVNLLKPLNYTLLIGNEKYIVNPSYIFQGSETSGEGLLEQDNKVYEFTLKNGEVTIGKESDEYKSIEDTPYNLNNYEPFKDENLSNYYYSSYYGGYTIFDTTLYSDFWDFTNTSASNTPYVFTLSYESNVLSVIEYYHNQSGGLGGNFIDIEDIGNSNVEVIDNYLGI